MAISRVVYAERAHSFFIFEEMKARVICGSTGGGDARKFDTVDKSGRRERRYRRTVRSDRVKIESAEEERRGGPLRRVFDTKARTCGPDATC